MQNERESRIDLVRGFSLLMIFIGHSSFVFSYEFQQSRGFSDAAELFVLMAGMSSALAYYSLDRRRWFGKAARRTSMRALKLYAIHVVLAAALVLAARLDIMHSSAEILEVLQVSTFWNDPSVHAFEIFTMRYMPSFMDILPLYVVLLLLVPAIFFLHDRSIILLLVLSAALWLCAGLARLNFVNMAMEGQRWYLDPLSWQFIFTIGIVLGIRMKQGLEPLPYHPLVFKAAAAFVLIAIPTNLLFQLSFLEWAASRPYHALTSKTNGGILRLVNAVAIIYVLWNLNIVRRMAKAAILEPVLAAGRNSLPVFVVGVILSTILTALMVSGAAVPLSVQLSLMVAGCALQLLVAEYYARRARDRRAAPARPLPGAQRTKSTTMGPARAR